MLINIPGLLTPPWVRELSMQDSINTYKHLPAKFYGKYNFIYQLSGSKPRRINNFTVFPRQKALAHIIHTSRLNIWQHRESNTSN